MATTPLGTTKGGISRADSQAESWNYACKEDMKCRKVFIKFAANGIIRLH
jgi:hypothetical protein